MTLLETTLSRIQPVDPALLTAAQTLLDNKTKPLGSLGRIEEFGRRCAAIQGCLKPVIGRKVIFTFAGDHGVAAEGVSAFPAEVTPQMVFNFLNGGAGVNVLARHAGAEVRVVDMGVNFDFGAVAGLIDRKVARGTRVESALVAPLASAGKSQVRHRSRTWLAGRLSLALALGDEASVTRTTTQIADNPPRHRDTRAIGIIGVNLVLFSQLQHPHSGPQVHPATRAPGESGPNHPETICGSEPKLKSSSHTA